MEWIEEVVTEIDRRIDRAREIYRGANPEKKKATRFETSLAKSR